MIVKTLEEKPKDATRRSTRSMAANMDIEPDDDRADLAGVRV